MCRDFDTLKEHDETIINTINKYVHKDDILYHLGDFSMGGRENIKKFRKKINCKTIHICEGNHDIFISKNSQFADGSRAHDLFTSVNQMIIKKIGKTNFTMCHYAFRTWNQGSRGAIMLHGHSHGNLTPYEKLLQIAEDSYLYKTGDLYKQMDVGIDEAYNIFGEYRPFHIDEIREIMDRRINLNVDEQ